VAGAAGPAGADGADGATGATGATGPAGPSGSTLVQDGLGTPTGTDPVEGTTFTDTATCAAGKVLLGGGGRLTTSVASERMYTAIVESYPSSTTVWTVVGIVTKNLSNGSTARATAYALCSL